MRPKLLLGLSATLATTIGIYACSTDDGGNVVGGDAGGTSSVGAGSRPGSGTGSSSSSSGGKSGSPKSGIDVSGTIDEDAACATDEKLAELTPVYMVFVYDSSQSMGDDPNGTWQHMASRWEPMREGMQYFFQNADQVGVQASIVFFAAKGGQADTCHYDYSTPDVAMTSLQTPQALIDGLNKKMPNGGTPTLPAVMGGLKYAKKLIGNNPGSKAVVVLITDGEPYPDVYEDGSGEKVGCTPTYAPTLKNNIEDISTVIKEYANNASTPILTYVVGIGDANKVNMAQLASAGNTELIFIDTEQPPEKTTEALVQNLQSIRTKQIGCSMLVPTENFDPKAFNVKFKHSDGTVEELSNSPNCTGPGWYFVPEDNPKQFTLCPSVCEKIQKDLNGTLQYVLGCPTRVI